MVQSKKNKTRYKNLAEISKELGLLLGKIKKAESSCEAVLNRVHSSQRMSAINLVHYLALRREDIRELQDQLHIHGLSSLASSESHIQYQVQAILQRLGNQTFKAEEQVCDFFTGMELIKNRSEALFGHRKSQVIPSLMVTFDPQFITEYNMVERLLKAGMNVARINTAHDKPEDWVEMIQMVHKACETTGIPCRIYMDLAGPKLRTSILGKGRGAGKVILYEGQEIFLAESGADYDPFSVVVGCEEPGLISQLKHGDRILFDDGLIETVVSSKKSGIAALRVKRVSSKKQQLKSGKGINFPDSSLHLDSLSAYDLQTIPFVCEHADIVGYSFIRQPEDVAILQAELAKYSRRPALILKIETPEAVKQFPSILFQGMKEDLFGVMIARGDLAVEIGFERLSEIQEEIVWFCEAAHVPVIWATQVLETLNKSGIATRSEITDAAFAGMSECVMINKGDYVISVMKTLKDILRRSSGHHAKKRYTFRPMQIAADFFGQFVADPQLKQ